MNSPKPSAQVLLRGSHWMGICGALLVICGLGCLSFFVFLSRRSFEVTLSDRTAYWALAVGTAFFCGVGVVMLFRFFGLNQPAVFKEEHVNADDGEYLVTQLSRNFEILRAQTNNGFLLSSVFMTLGLIVIIASIIAPRAGIDTQGFDKVGLMAGIVSEFISATALLLYRLNFSRLNATSDRLDEAWRVLMAYKLTRELPEDKKAEATLQLIGSLSSRPIKAAKE